MWHLRDRSHPVAIGNRIGSEIFHPRGFQMKPQPQYRTNKNTFHTSFALQQTGRSTAAIICYFLCLRVLLRTRLDVGKSWLVLVKSNPGTAMLSIDPFLNEAETGKSKRIHFISMQCGSVGNDWIDFNMDFSTVGLCFYKIALFCSLLHSHLLGAVACALFLSGRQN